MQHMTDPEMLIDARGLKCPLPVLKLRKALLIVPSQQVKLLADDPMAWVDIPHFCAESGYILVSQGHKAGNDMEFIVRKS